MAKNLFGRFYVFRRSPMEKDRVLELLEAADWDDIILRLTYYAAFRFQRYGWKSDLPKGISPDDIAIIAIEKVWDRTRDWDPDKYPDLLTHLKWIVKSDVEHLFSSLEHKTTDQIPVIINEDGTKVELGETACEHPHSISTKVLSPEEELIAKQKEKYGKALIAELHDAVKGDDNLELLLLCFEEGVDKPEAIAIETNWNISKVYNLKRKLLRKAAKIGKNITRTKEE
jgi:hypothetical protein